MTEMTVDGETQQRRVAVVTGANRGIGFEIARQLLASGGDITVVLTSRDEARGLQAMEKLKQQQQLLPTAGAAAAAALEFHQLDVTDAGSVAELADFIKTCFGKLDILVNNAGVTGFVLDPHRHVLSSSPEESASDTREYESETEKLYKAVAASPAATLAGAREAIDVNLYGTKRTTEALLPLLRLSPSPRIVNVSSISGMLQLISNERVREELNDVDGLTEDRLDELLMEFLDDFGDGKLEEKGWPARMSPGYSVSKAAMNAYTRKLAGSERGVVAVNCVWPGFARTDMTGGLGPLSAAQGAANVVGVALLPHGGPSGLFFRQSQPSPTY